MTAWLNDLAAWWAALEPEWVFLVLLALFVGVAGLLADWPVAGRRFDSRNAEDAKVRRRRKKYL
jgi:hypothetical protein